MIRPAASQASSAELKIARIVRVSCGLGVRRTQTFVTMASVPSLPTRMPTRSSPVGVFDGAKPQDRAVGQHGFESEHVVGRYAVFKRVRAAGVGGHVAADGAGGLAGRVGGEVIARAGQRLGELQVDRAGLDDGHAIAEVDVEDFVHPRKQEDDATLATSLARGRHPPARLVPAPRAMTAASYCRQSFTTSATSSVERGKTTAVGPAALDREGVAIVDGQLRRGREDILAAEGLAEVGNQRCGHR